MARIPVEVVERLKAEVAVQRLAEARGVVLEKRGADLHGRCPFHDDRTPSLVITPAKNLWHCLGACQTGGSVIDWVMRDEGVSFRHAVELLVNDSFPLAAASSSPPPKHSTVKKLPTALVRDVVDAKLMIQVIEYYRETLFGSPGARLLEASRHRLRGRHQNVQAGLRQSHVGVPVAGEHTRRGRGAARTADLALPAQVIPDAPAPLALPETNTLGADREYVLSFGPRRYRVRGLEKNLSYEALKVNLLAATPLAGLDRPGDHSEESRPQAVHVDTLELYQARARAAFVKSAAAELGVTEEIIKGDVGKVLLALEAEQEKLITAALAPKAAAAVTIDEPARARAMSLLTSADLIERIAADFGRSGVVGERSNALVGYLAAISRKLDRPLALLIQCTSAAGKSSLLDAVLKFVPEEDRIVESSHIFCETPLTGFWRGAGYGAYPTRGAGAAKGGGPGRALVSTAEVDLKAAGKDLRGAMCQHPSIHHQQLFARSRFSPQHDPTEADLDIDSQNEFRKLCFAHAPIERRAQLRHLRILGHGFEGREMQLVIHPQDTFGRSLGYGQHAGHERPHRRIS